MGRALFFPIFFSKSHNQSFFFKICDWLVGEKKTRTQNAKTRRQEDKKTSWNTMLYGSMPLTSSVPPVADEEVSPFLTTRKVIAGVAICATLAVAGVLGLESKGE